MTVEEMISAVRRKDDLGEQAKLEISNASPTNVEAIVKIEARQYVISFWISVVFPIFLFLLVIPLFILSWRIEPMSISVAQVAGGLAWCTLITAVILSVSWHVIPTRGHLNAIVALTYVHDSKALPGLVKTYPHGFLPLTRDEYGSRLRAILNVILSLDSRGDPAVERAAIVGASLVLTRNFDRQLALDDQEYDLTVSLLQVPWLVQHTKTRRTLKYIACAKCRVPSQTNMQAVANSVLSSAPGRL